MSEWTAKAHYPDLSGAKLISFDLETKDPDLPEKGPSTFRGGGYVVGFSIATDDGFAGYYPIRHEGGGNLDRFNTLMWLKRQLETPIPKVGANLPYDIEWAQADLGIYIKGPKWDVQVADPLLDENWSSYALDAICRRRLGIGKDETLLYEAGVKLGFVPTGDTDEERKASVVKKVKPEIWKLPAHLVGPYGTADADLPIKIFRQQEKELREQGLWSVFELEAKVIDVLVAMRFKGVPVDVDRAQRTADELDAELRQLMINIERRVGFRPNVWAAEDMERVCRTLDLKFPRTDKLNSTGKAAVKRISDLAGTDLTKLSIPKIKETIQNLYAHSGVPENIAALLAKVYDDGGNASFEADWMAKQEHPIFGMLLEARQLDRSGSVFVKDNIIGTAVRGRIHAQFLQVKSDRGGTVSGRFSSKQPNLQQVPARNEKIATRIRSLFRAEPGCSWFCGDVIGQEPRMTIHYARLLNLSKAQAACDLFNANPQTKEHQLVADWTGLPYKQAKEINLGKAYGMGMKKYAEKYGKTLAEAKELYYTYDQALPYKKELSQHCERVVKQRGFLKTLAGRHMHFNLFGPVEYRDGVVPKRYDEAVKEFGLPVVRYFTYKALNRLIQGSSADMIKLAMVRCVEAGYTPNITVHDELDFADIRNMDQAREIKRIMETCVDIQPRIVAEIEMGPSWGEGETVKHEDLTYA